MVESDAKDEINIIEHAQEKDLLLEHDQVKWKPVNRPITLQNIRDDHVLSTEVEATSVDHDLEHERAEQEKARRLKLIDQVHAQFRVHGTKFYFKDQPDKIAFKDKGERMVTSSNDGRAAKAMVVMAEAKGWQTIKVSGHADFRREVWMEANFRGIKTHGYKPTEQDLKQLEEKCERAMHNTLERATPLSPEAERKTDSAQQNGPVKAAKVALRAYTGRVLEHGVANFNHDPEEKPNYFVKLETNEGEKTVWGIDLKRAMSEGKVKAGDDVNLEYRGKTPVTVEALKRDKAGKVIGREEITTNRNQWDVQKSDKAKVAEVVASSLIDSKLKDPTQREEIAPGSSFKNKDELKKHIENEVIEKRGNNKSTQQILTIVRDYIDKKFPDTPEFKDEKLAAPVAVKMRR